MADRPLEPRTYDELLLESARLARRIAPTLCRTNPVTGTHCGPSHGLWQTLRLLGLALSPVYHQEFFQRALDRMQPRAEPLRVLVSGAADYAMLAQVVAALRRRAMPFAATVLDLCETPLALNRWYAGRIGVPIETHRGDILDYAPAEPFDGICTHSFLALFPIDRRPALLAKWRELLRPGGLAITVNRVRPGHAAAQVGFAAPEVDAYCETVRAKALAFGPSLGVDPDELAREARRYALEQRFYPLRSADELRVLFEQAGFRVDELECAPIDPAARASGTAPTVPGTAEYLRIIATRR